MEDNLNYILIPGRNRSEFFDITLDSLMDCPEIKDYQILFAFENDVLPEYYDIIKRYVRYPSQIEIKRWDMHYGLTRGHLEGMKIAFQKTDEYVIVVEDDVRVSRDFLRYMDYCYRHFYKEHSDIGTISGQMSRDSVSGERDVRLIHKRQWYSPYGVLIPKKFFDELLLPHCTEAYYKDPRYPDEYYPEWKHKGKYIEQAGLINRIIHKNNLYCLEPEVPRCQDIGFYGKNRHCRFADYKILTLNEKIRWNLKLLSDVELLKKVAYSGPYFVLGEDNEWKDLEMVE